MDWSIVADALPKFALGLRITLALLAASVLTGLLLSIPLAVARVSARRWLAWPVLGFTYALRGTPLLVQLFMIYFGLAQFTWMRDSLVWPLFKSAWFCSWLALSLNTTAYTTEMLAGALRATPHGEMEAARAAGMGPGTVLRRILLPGALRRALPQYGNEVVLMLHATSLASTVSLVELTRVARDVYEEHFVVTEAFGTVGVFYFVLTFLLVGGFRLLERRYLRHLAPKRAGADPRMKPA